MPPPGGWDGFRLQLYRLRPPTLDSMGTLASEARNFSWASLPPGAEFRLLLVTLRGPDQSRSANASAWTRECHSPPPHRPRGRASTSSTSLGGQLGGPRPAPRPLARPSWPGLHCVHGGVQCPQGHWPR